MSSIRPRYELASVYVETADGSPRLYTVSRGSIGAFNRREALGASIGLPAAISLLQVASADAQTKPASVLRAHNAGIYSLAVTPNGATLASGSGDKTIRLWNLRNGTHPAPPATQRDEVFALVVEPNGSTLAAGYRDGSVQLWSLSAGNLVKTLSGHVNAVTSVVFSSDGERLLSASKDGTVRVWNYPDGSLITTLRAPRGPVHSVAVSKDGSLIAMAAADISICSGSFWATRRILTGHTQDVADVAFAPAADRVVSGSWDGTLRLWSLSDFSFIASIPAHRKPVNAIAVLPEGMVAGASDDGSIKVWHMQDGKLYNAFGSGAAVNTLALTPDGEILISGDQDGVITLWDWRKGMLKSFFFEKQLTPVDAKGRSYSIYDRITGETITYTLPCGSPMPAGATCVCDCVAGTYDPTPPRPAYSGGGGGYSPSTSSTTCQCDTVCTCNLVYY